MDFLFSPYTLPNGVEIKNRLVVAPMTHWGADVHTGVITDAERNFLKGRAEGFGMFILAATLVARGGKSFAGEPHAICGVSKNVPGLFTHRVRKRFFRFIMAVTRH